MKKSILLAGVLVLAACEQSTMVFDPVNNKASTASTAATQGTITMNIAFPLTDTNHQNQIFSVLLFQSGTLVAGLPNTGAGTTSATGTASVQLLLPDVNNCLNGTAASLANGSYDVYFSIRVAGDATIDVSNAGTPCNPNGFLIYSNLGGNFSTGRGTMNVTGDSTYNITNTNTATGLKHTFTLQAGPGLNGKLFRCYLVDPNMSAISATTQPIAIYNGAITENINGDGCSMGYPGPAPTTDTTLVGGVCTNTVNARIYLPPPGSYKYFCYIDVDNNGTYGNTGDRYATGTLNVNGANTTFLNATAFSTLP